MYLDVLAIVIYSRICSAMQLSQFSQGIQKCSEKICYATQKNYLLALLTVVRSLELSEVSFAEVFRVLTENEVN